jgi:hypothetical protein
MPEVNLPPQGEVPQTDCELDILIVKFQECALSDDIGSQMLPDCEVVKKLLRRENPNLTAEQVEIMVACPEDFEEIQEEPGKNEQVDKENVSAPGRRKLRRKRKFPTQEPPQPIKDDGSPKIPSPEVEKKKKKYKNCYEEYQKFEAQYQKQIDELTQKRIKLLSQNSNNIDNIDQIENNGQSTFVANLQEEVNKIDNQISDLQLQRITSEEKKNQCLKNLLDQPDEAPEQSADGTGGISIPSLVFACKAARDEIKKYNEQIKKLERIRDEVKKQNDSVKLQSINSEIQRIEKLKKDIKNDKCKKGAGGSSNFNTAGFGLGNIDLNLQTAGLNIGGLGLGGVNAGGFSTKIPTDFPPFPKMKLGLPDIEQHALDLRGVLPLSFPNTLFKQAINLKLEIRVCVSRFLKLFKDLIVDLIKLGIKIATGVPGAAIMVAPPTFNIPAAISFVLLIIDGISDIIKRVKSAIEFIPCLKKLNFVLPDVNFCKLVGTINLALKFFNALCGKLGKFDLLICKIISKILKVISKKKKPTIRGLKKDIEKKQEELGELNNELNNADSEEAKAPIKKQIDDLNEEIRDIQKRIEKTQNQQESATTAEQASLAKNLIGAAACLVPLLALLKKQNYDDADPGETPLTDDIPPIEDFFEPVKTELDSVLTYVYDVMFEDGSMLYDISKEYIDELRKLGYNVVLNF